MAGHGVIITLIEMVINDAEFGGGLQLSMENHHHCRECGNMIAPSKMWCSECRRKLPFAISTKDERLLLKKVLLKEDKGK